MSKLRNPPIIVVLAALGLHTCTPAWASRLETHNISLSGIGSGGVLRLVDLANGRDVSIQTQPCEPAESVVKRLASVIDDTDPFKWYSPTVLTTRDKMHSQGPSLGPLPGFFGGYVFAGTETGLGIPRPPTSLSCSYDPNSDRIVVRWVNPPEGYDSICVMTGAPPLAGCGRPGRLTEYVMDKKGRDISKSDFCVYGSRNGVLSPPAIIRLSNHAQEEVPWLPFYNGLAPNWLAWSTAAPDKNTFEQGEKQATSGRSYPASPKTTKPYYQIIKAPPKGTVHGVYRKFLGLTPGHTYRLSASVSTLDMDSVQRDWSFSLCAAPHTPDKKDLTAQQLAGLEALPDGKAGHQDGAIARFGPGHTTKGKFKTVNSGNITGTVLTAPDITLPTYVDTITVWTRFVCSDPNGAVGFTGVKLEDVTTAK